MRIKHGIRPARSTDKAGLWLGGFIGALLAGPLPAATLGLVVGINQFVQPNPPLKGAINDAQDIRAALETVGVKDVIVLLDGQATRKAIIAAWNQQVRKAKPGDTLIFTYAGH
ncbi:MAG: caspase family protein [Candidatus Competibacteraceae bacterium]|nr:caspase family protein [Candidatus Competibacteraceae bacterium]